jgi:subtilisin-like proprotein convertase family protein
MMLFPYLLITLLSVFKPTLLNLYNMKTNSSKITVFFISLLLTGFSLFAVPPVNDVPCNAVVIPVNGIVYYYDNTDATFDVNEVTPPAGTNPDGTCVSKDGWCFSDLSVDNSVWFTFTAPASGKVTISTCDALTVIDNQLAVYSVGSCSDYNTYTLMGANDDAPAGCSVASGGVAVLYLSGLAPGNTYYIQIDGYIGDEGLFGISITESFNNGNDDICNAQSIALSATPVCSDNFFATAAQGEPAGSNWANGDGVQNSVWFKFTAPSSGKVYFSTDNLNTTFDTQIGIYGSSDNTCNGTLTELASNDDAGTIYFVASETDVICLRPGNTYFIQVDGFSGAFGEFCLVANDTATTTGLTPSITASTNNACEGTAFTVISTAAGGVPGLGGTVNGNNSNSFNIPDFSLTGATSPITLSGASGSVTPSGEVTVTLNISHTYVADLSIYLVGPDNCGALELSTGNGGSGDNYVNTILTTSATNIIGSGGNNTAPFTGTYRPEGTISTPPASNTFSLPTTAINGCPIDGIWTLKVFDAVSGDNGTLNNWSLSITESFYQHQISGPGTIQTAISGVNNNTATGTITNAPIGNNAYITKITDVAGCSHHDTVFVKVFDTPDILSVSTSCVTGSNGIITINASLDNANFSGNDIGVIEYSFDGGNTWGTTNTSIGYAIGTYSVGVRNSANITCQKSGFVTLQTSPSLTVTQTSPVCEGTGVTISATATGGNQFTNSGNATPNVAIPDNNTTGVSSPISILGIGNVAANSIISVTLNITHPYVGDVYAYLVGPGNCGTLELTTNNGSGGANYTNTVLNTSAPLSITSGLPPYTGTFRPEGTITGTNTNTVGLPANGINGCPVNGNWTLRVFDLSSGDVGTLNNWSLSITRTGDLIHNVTGNGTIGTITNSGVNNANGVVTVSDLPVGANEFIYTVTALSGCTIADTFDIKVFDTPVINNLSNTCSSGADGTITVSASTLNNSNFSGNDIGVIEYSYDGGNTWTTDNPGTGFAPNSYDVYVRNSAHPSCISGPQSVTILFATGAFAGNDVTICTGFSTTLTATGGVGYEWSTSETTTSISVSPLVDTDYTVTVTAANGCTSTDEVTVFVQTSLDPNLGSDFTICEGNSATLTANAGDTYDWSTNETTASITVTPLVNTTYSVTVSDANGCSGTGSITITVVTNIDPNLPPTINICSGNSATLTASGGGAYLWSTTETTSSITVSPTSNATYSVTVTNSGCSGTASTLVTVQSLPDPNLPSFVSVCIGSSTTFTASGGGTYLWSTNETTASITVSPSTNSIYTVTVTNSGCSATGSVDVTVSASPNPNLPASVNICDGSSTTLTASGGGTYQWSTNETTASITASPSTNTTFTVTVTNGGCSATGSTLVNVQSLPNPNLPSSASVCNGAPIALTASGGGTYLWSTNETTASITVSPSVNTIYSVTVTNGSCTATGSTNVTVSSVPVPNLPSNVTICNGSSTTLTASGGGTYLWNTTETTASITVSPSANTNYSVTVTNGGCSATGNTLVSVTNLPNPNTPPSITICNGETTTITASGGGTYLWNTNETTASITVSPSVNTPYSVTVTNNGCNGTATTNVIVNTAPVVNIPDQQVCGGNSATLDAGNPGATYEWSTNETTQTITVSVPDVYSVTVTAGNGCSATDGATVVIGGSLAVTLPDSVDFCSGSFVQLDADNAGSDYQWSTGATTQTIIVTTGGVVSVTVTNQGGCSGSASTLVIENSVPVADAGQPQSLCPGESVTLVATGGTGYIWSNGNQGAINIVSPAQNTTYRVTVTGTGGCQSEDSVTVTLHAPVTITVSNDTTVCAFTQVTINATGGITYLWNTNATTATINVTPVNPTTYDVTVTDANGCSASGSVTVTALPLPNVNAGSDVGICEGGTVTVYATGSGTFEWSNGATTSTLTVTPLTTTFYQLTVTGANGCTRTDDVTVNVNPLPIVSVSMSNTVFCVNDAASSISVSPNGGTLSGSGISGTTFTPSDAGVGGHIISYSFTDNNQCTATDYLAVAVDACSGIDELMSALESAQVFPNPFSNKITIRFTSLNEDEITVKLSDVLGRELLNEAMQIKLGENMLTLNTGNELAGGVYYIQLIKANRMIPFKLFRME